LRSNMYLKLDRTSLQARKVLQWQERKSSRSNRRHILYYVATSYQVFSRNVTHSTFIHMYYYCTNKIHYSYFFTFLPHHYYMTGVVT
jgi:hypothetical protein